MEISDLMPPFVQNHDRILPETIEKDDQAWKYALFSTKAVEFSIKRQAIQLDTIVRCEITINSWS